MALINLGSFGNIGGRSVGSGLASGLDTESLINSLVDARKISVTKLEDKVELNTNKLSAYSEMRGFLTSFKTALDGLRNAAGFDNDETNSFKARSVFLSSNTSVEGSTYMGVTAAAGAAIDSYEIEITNLAVAKSQLSQGFASKTASATEAAGGATAGMFSAGTIQLNGTLMTIEEGDSLIEIEANINSLSGTTGVSASIIQVADNDFRLNIKSVETGIANAFTIVDGASVMDEVTFVTTAADDARLTFNNIPIQRASNTIDDIVDDVTFSLFQPTPTLPTPTVLTTEISTDNDSVKDAIITFIGAYNDFMTFAARQQERDTDGTYLDTAYLSKEPPLQAAMNDAMAYLSSSVSGVSGKSMLSEIGITFYDYAGDDETPFTANLMTLDQTELDTALSEDYDGVRKVFEFDFNASSSKLGAYTRSNALDVTAFSVDIDDTRAVGDQVRITYTDANGVVQNINTDYTAVSGGGGTLVGQDGTVLEGFTMLYSGDGTDVITVSLSQGIADKLYNSISGFLEDDGLIDTSEDALTTDNTRADDEITKKNTLIDQYRDRLLQQYSLLEETVTRMNSILQMLQAQADAQAAAS